MFDNLSNIRNKIARMKQCVFGPKPWGIQGRRKQEEQGVVLGTTSAASKVNSEEEPGGV